MNTRATIDASQVPRWKTNTHHATIKGSQGNQHTCNNHSFARVTVEKQHTYNNHSFASASVKKQHTGNNQSFATDSGKGGVGGRGAGRGRTVHIQQSFARASENTKHTCNCGTCAGTLGNPSACAGTLGSLSALLRASCFILVFRWSLAMAVRLLEVIT